MGISKRMKVEGFLLLTIWADQRGNEGKQHKSMYYSHRWWSKKENVAWKPTRFPTFEWKRLWETISPPPPYCFPNVLHVRHFFVFFYCYNYSSIIYIYQDCTAWCRNEFFKVLSRLYGNTCPKQDENIDWVLLASSCQMFFFDSFPIPPTLWIIE